jgi:hypothetical protein
MAVEQPLDLRRMAKEARQLAELLPDPRAIEHLHTHAEKLEAMASKLESELCDS